MRMAIAFALAVGFPALALADDIPDLKGAWTADFDFVIFGNNGHHPGDQSVETAPRSGTITFTFDIEGQDGRKLWGHSFSDPAKREPFALVLAPDGKTVFGADTDGLLQLTLTGADAVQLCYAHPGTSPSGSIVASCGTATRKK